MNILDYINRINELYGNQEPRTMDQAALVDDLEPGALKDELLKDFDPSQETYEEYLQRKSLERPFNMAEGGRTGFKDGNGVYDEDTEKNLLGKRVNELMDEGYDFGEAVKQAMKEGYAKGGRAGYNDGQLVTPSVDGSRPGYQGTDVHMYDSYGKALEKINLPEGYITPYEFSKKHGLPTTETGGKKKSIIGNHLQRPQRLDSPHTVNRAQVFLMKKLKPKQIMVRGQPVWVVKDDRVGGKLAKEVINYFDSTLLPEKTMNNINKILTHKKYKPIKKLFNQGDYKGIKNALMNLTEFTQAEKSNIMLRIAQGMDGRGFRDFNLNIKENKGNAKKIFRGLEKEQWGDPFGSAYRSLKRDTITAGIGDKYFTSNYGSMLQKAKNILKKNNIWFEGMDLNELTGLSSGYKNQTFSSTQFVNLMDAEFNRGDHANMLKEYSKHEARLQKALKGEKPNFDQAANEVKKWKAWKKDWFDNLDPRYKTDKIKSILPDFKITDKASKVFTEKRLEEFRKQNFPIAEEIKKQGYAKISAPTKKARSEIPLLREVAFGDKKALEQIKKQKIFSNFWCGTKKAYGGRIGFANGSGCPDSVKQKNFLKMTNDVGKGRITGEAAEQIAKNAAKVVARVGSKSALASILGPAGIGIDLAYEVGSIGFDMAMDSNVSLKQALQNNWLTGAFIEGTGQEEYNKGLVNFDSSAKPMATIQNLIEKIEREEKNLERMETSLVRGDYTGEAKKELLAKQEALIKNLYNDFDKVARKKATSPGHPEGEQVRYLALEEESPERIAFDRAKQEYDSIGEAKALLKRKSKHGFEESLKTSRAEPWIDFGLSINPKYGKYSKRELDKRLKEFGDYFGYGWTPYGLGYGMQQMQPGIGDMKYNEDLGYREMADALMMNEAWDNLSKGAPNMADGGRAGYMGGGITGIRKPSSIPPKSGPMSEGLRSLYNNGRKW